MIILLVDELLAIAKIDYKYFICLFAQPHQKVRRVNIVVNKIFGVDPLNPVDKLVHYQQSSLETELTLTELQKMLKRRPINISNHRTVIMLNSKPVQIGHADTTLDNPVDFGLLLYLRCERFIKWLELDSNLFLIS
jgi:hypothetical protein